MAPLVDILDFRVGTSSFFYVPSCPECACGATGERGSALNGARQGLATDILLIRHARHDDFDVRLSGRRDGVALSAEGREQAQRLARRLSGERIDRVEASPLDRTRATAEALGRAVTIEPALIEIDMGEWTGRALNSFAGDPAWRDWNEHRATARIPGGESMAEAQARIVDHLRRTARDHDGLTVAMVSHSDMIRAAIAYALGLSLDNLLRFDIEPASVSRLVVGDWGARVVSLNEGLANG